MSTRWYALALKARTLSGPRLDELIAALGGRRVARSKLCTLNKLARIHPRIGEVMDELVAPWRVVRFVVHGQGAAVQRKRAEESLAALVARREVKGAPSALAREVLASLDDLI